MDISMENGWWTDRQKGIDEQNNELTSLYNVHPNPYLIFFSWAPDSFCLSLLSSSSTHSNQNSFLPESVIHHYITYYPKLSNPTVIPLSLWWFITGAIGDGQMPPCGQDMCLFSALYSLSLAPFTVDNIRALSWASFPPHCTGDEWGLIQGHLGLFSVAVLTGRNHYREKSEASNGPNIAESCSSLWTG